MARKARRPSPARKRVRRKPAAKPKRAGRTVRATPAKPRRPVRKKLRRPGRKKAARPAPRRSRPAGARSRPAARKKPAVRPRTPAAPVPEKTPHLDRPRRILAEGPTVPSPPSSLNLDRHPSAARSGRDDMRHRAARTALGTSLNAGDSDVNTENAYFTGDETPGGDNPSPDQDVVEEIGRALGVEYHDNEELRGSDKIADRDKHRWELDPASSEDYKNRK